jgi:hypothetical protein
MVQRMPLGSISEFTLNPSGITFSRAPRPVDLFHPGHLNANQKNLNPQANSQPPSVLMIFYTLVCWGTVIFVCLPAPAFWDSGLRRLPTTKCYFIVAFTNIGLMNTGINIATDVLLVTLPVHIIWNLQINRDRRLR